MRMENLRAGFDPPDPNEMFAVAYLQCLQTLLSQGRTRSRSRKIRFALNLEIKSYIKRISHAMTMRGWAEIGKNKGRKKLLCRRIEPRTNSFLIF